jgi:ribosome-associated translation inhibitor RaiA
VCRKKGHLARVCPQEKKSSDDEKSEKEYFALSAGHASEVKVVKSEGGVLVVRGEHTKCVLEKAMDNVNRMRTKTKKKIKNRRSKNKSKENSSANGVGGVKKRKLTTGTMKAYIQTKIMPEQNYVQSRSLIGINAPVYHQGKIRGGVLDGTV